MPFEAAITHAMSFKNRDWCLIFENDVWFVRMFVADLPHPLFVWHNHCDRVQCLFTPRIFLVVSVRTAATADPPKTAAERWKGWYVGSSSNASTFDSRPWLGLITRLKHGFGRATGYGMMTETVISNSCKQKRQVFYPHLAITHGVVC